MNTEIQLTAAENGTSHLHWDSLIIDEPCEHTHTIIMSRLMFTDVQLAIMPCARFSFLFPALCGYPASWLAGWLARMSAAQSGYD